MVFGWLGRFGIIALVYVKTLLRNVVFYLYLLLIVALIPSLLELSDVQWGVFWEVLGPDHVVATTFSYFIFFTLFAFLAISALDIYVILKLNAQPPARTTVKNVYFSLLNLIVLVPAVFYVLYVVWVVFPQSFAIVVTLYVILLALSLASTSIKISGIYALLATATALTTVSTSQTFVTAATALTITIWMFRALLTPCT